MLEIIATTLEDAKRIEDAGADRIELVSALTEGGITPSYGLIKKVVQSVKIPVNVMIRPHAKSFIYSKNEIKIMMEDILIAKELRVNGVVLGTLDENNEICISSLEKLLQVCDGIDVTFHRAIDQLPDLVRGIDTLKRYAEIKNVLTSGGKGDILKNAFTIKQMVRNSDNIKVLVGGGLNFNNIKDIMKTTKAPQYHFGTAVRCDRSVLGEIDKDKLKRLVKLVGDSNKYSKTIN